MFVDRVINLATPPLIVPVEITPEDIVFVEIDTVGESIDSEQVFGSVEAVKTVSDLFMPISGEITEFNGLLEKAPETVNSDPYGDGWMVKVKMTNADDISNLLSAADYKALIGH